jgi:DNA mismatch endonuclease (patch repair protein)
LFLGWTVLRFWGTDIKKHTDERAVEESIAEIVFEGSFTYEDDTKEM